MSSNNYSVNRKRQPLAKLALESNAPSDLSESKVAECPPMVKRRRGRPSLPPEVKAGRIMAFRVNKARGEAYDAAVAASGKPFHEWVTEILDAASNPNP